jgi:hypothetical protein
MPAGGVAHDDMDEKSRAGQQRDIRDAITGRACT